MTDARDLLAANLAVFGSRDADARRALIDAHYAEDVRFTDPEGTVTGRDALDAKAGALLGTLPPEFAFAESGPAYIDGELAVLAWELGPVGAPAAARGIDILTIRDGLIAELRTILA